MDLKETTAQAAFQNKPYFIVQILLTVVGAIGIPALFLPFLMKNSLFWGLTENQVRPHALPFFLAIFITGTSAHWLIAGKLSRIERITAYLLGATAFCSILYYYFGIFIGFSLKDIFHSSPREIIVGSLVYITPVIVVIAGALALVKIRKDVALKTYAAIMCMQVVYLVNCPVSMGGWWIGGDMPSLGDLLSSLTGDSGYWCCLVAAVAYTIQMVMQMLVVRRRSSISLLDNPDSVRERA